MPLLRFDLDNRTFKPLLKVAAAQPAELGEVMEILAEASAELVGRGINQWPFPPSPGLWRMIEEQIGLGQVYLARLPDTGEPAGTIRFTWRHETVWPDNMDDAGYVHTLAMRPALRGRQLGVALLAWAADHIRALERRWLRLDCIAGSKPLRQYYERLGFEERGVAVVHGYELARYELDLWPPNVG